MLRFLKDSKLRIKKIAAVHGEEEKPWLFEKFLENEGFNVIVPRAGETCRSGKIEEKKIMDFVIIGGMLPA